MNKQELLSELDKIHVPHSTYNLDGRLPVTNTVSSKGAACL